MNKDLARCNITELSTKLDITELARQAKEIAKSSTCKRVKYGAILYDIDTQTIIGKGSNKQVTGECHICMRKFLNIPHGTQYETCRSIHAEIEATLGVKPGESDNRVIILAAVNSDGSYYTDHKIECCVMCRRMILKLGIPYVVYVYGENKDGILTYEIISTEEWRKDPSV